jgi:hypothetical protein
VVFLEIILLLAQKRRRIRKIYPQADKINKLDHYFGVCWQIPAAHGLKTAPIELCGDTRDGF